MNVNFAVRDVSDGYAGSSIRVTIHIRNLGVRTAHDVFVELEIYDANSPDDILLIRKVEPILSLVWCSRSS